jgi:metallo-beta-lactamase family protein
MAIDAGEIYAKHREDHNLKMTDMEERGESPLESTEFHSVRESKDSEALHQIKHPAIIVSASGMATGGRILHHLKRRLPNAKTTVLFVGFQAQGTRGRALKDGIKQIKIHGQLIPVRAKIEAIDGLSAHADRAEIMKWLAGFKRPPKQVYIVHGEPEAAESLAALIRGRLGWKARVAQDGETVMLRN